VRHARVMHVALALDDSQSTTERIAFEHEFTDARALERFVRHALGSTIAQLRNSGAVRVASKATSFEGVHPVESPATTSLNSTCLPQPSVPTVANTVAAAERRRESAEP